ncbi:MAG: MraY family glycosyltransferase [Phycisphaerae bacterium]
MWKIVLEYRYVGLTAFVVTVLATPIAIRLANVLGVLDRPDKLLKPHARPIPYLGGAAICLGWAVAAWCAIVWGQAELATLLPVLLGGVAVSIVGLIDDVRDLPPKTRLAITTLIIATVMILTGTGFRLIDSLTMPLFDAELPRAVAAPIAVLLGCFVVLGACNSTNLIDGLDGLCSGVTSIISLGFFLLASHLAAHQYSVTGDPVRLVLAIAMVGAAVGFLPFNFNPARIFMGDAGSMLLGYNCGMMILLFAENGIFRWVIGALMIFALPVFDTALAMFRRWRSGRSIFEGDRSHFYDQLVQRGMSVKQTVLTCYLLTVVFGLIGLTTIFMRTRWAIVVYVGVCALTALLAWRTGLAHPEQRKGGD